jgi:hypothetical protein
MESGEKIGMKHRNSLKLAQFDSSVYILILAQECTSRGHGDISPLGELPPCVSAFPYILFAHEPQHLCHL